MIIKTYSDLAQEYRDFADGKFPLVVVSGPPGTAKSEHGRIHCPALPGTRAWINGRTTGYGLWLSLRANKDQQVVIDDADDLFNDRQAVQVLKQVCGDGTRRVSWATGTTMKLATAGVEAEDDEDTDDNPFTFTTNSPVMILTNRWEGRESPHVRAVSDRGLIIRFEPSCSEIHAYVDTWRQDARNSRGALKIEEAVFAFVEENLSVQPQLSIRHYEIASERMRLGRNWKQELIDTWDLQSPKSVVRRLFFDESFESEGHRARAFQAETGLSEARYRQIKDELALPKRRRGGPRAGAGRPVKVEVESEEAPKNPPETNEKKEAS